MEQIIRSKKLNEEPTTTTSAKPTATSEPATTTTTTTESKGSSAALKEIKLNDMAKIMGAIVADSIPMLNARLAQGYNLNQSGLVLEKKYSRFIEYCTMTSRFFLIPTLIKFGEKAHLVDLIKIKKS